MNYKHIIFSTISLFLLLVAATAGVLLWRDPSTVIGSGFDEIPLTGQMWSENTGWISFDGQATNADNDPYQVIMQMTRENSAGVYTKGIVKNNPSNNYLGRYGWAGGKHLGWLDFAPPSVYTPTYGVEFDGSNERIEDTDAGNYINGLDEITVSMWVKSNETNTDKGFVDGESPNSTDNKLIMRYDRDGWWNTVDRSNTIKIGLTIDGTEVNANASSDTQTTDWQHVVMTWSSGNEMKLYIDGVRDTDLKIASANPDGLSPSGVITDVDKLILGKGSKDITGSWNGAIDDFRLFSRELSSTEVSQLYTRDTDTLDSDGSLLVHYSMDSGTGDTLLDNSSNTRNAVNSSGALTWIETGAKGDGFAYASNGGDQEGGFEGKARFIAGKEDNDGWEGWLKFAGTAQNDDTYQVERDYCDFTGHAWGGMNVGWVRAEGTANDGTDYGVKIDDTSCLKPEINFSTFKVNKSNLPNEDACRTHPSDPDGCLIDLTRPLNPDADPGIRLSWKLKNNMKVEDIANISITVCRVADKDPITGECDDPVDTRFFDNNPIVETTNFFAIEGGDRLVFVYEEYQFLDMQKLKENEPVYFEIITTNKFGDTHTLDTSEELSFDLYLKASYEVICSIVEKSGTTSFSGETIHTYTKVNKLNKGVTTDINNLVDIRLSLIGNLPDNHHIVDEGRFTEEDRSDLSYSVTFDGKQDYQDYLTTEAVQNLLEENPTSGANGGMITYHARDTNGDIDYPASKEPKDYVINYNVGGSQRIESESFILQNVRVGSIGSDLTEISNKVGELNIHATIVDTQYALHAKTVECPRIVNFGQRNLRESN